MSPSALHQRLSINLSPRVTRSVAEAWRTPRASGEKCYYIGTANTVIDCAGKVAAIPPPLTFRSG
jgi:hypothetical protein